MGVFCFPWKMKGKLKEGKNVLSKRRYISCPVLLFAKCVINVVVSFEQFSNEDRLRNYRPERFF